MRRHTREVRLDSSDSCSCNAGGPDWREGGGDLLILEQATSNAPACWGRRVGATVLSIRFLYSPTAPARMTQDQSMLGVVARGRLIRREGGQGGATATLAKRRTVVEQLKLLNSNQMAHAATAARARQGSCPSRPRSQRQAKMKEGARIPQLQQPAPPHSRAWPIFLFFAQP